MEARRGIRRHKSRAATARTLVGRRVVLLNTTILISPSRPAPLAGDPASGAGVPSLVRQLSRSGHTAAVRMMNQMATSSMHREVYTSARASTSMLSIGLALSWPAKAFLNFSNPNRHPSINNGHLRHTCLAPAIEALTEPGTTLKAAEGSHGPTGVGTILDEIAGPLKLGF